MTRKITPTSGFTLIELIVSMVLIAIVAASSIIILNEGFRNYFNSEEFTSKVWQSDLAIERFNREVRNASSFVSNSPSTSIQFIDTSGNIITYSLSGSSLTRQQNAAPAQVIADHITTLSFTYLDANASTTTLASNAYYLNATFDVSRANNTVQLTTTIHPRNL